MKRYNILLSLLFFFFTGCSSIVNYAPNSYIPRDGEIAVLPFQNNTDTPLAGQRVRNILANILYIKGFKVKTISLEDEDYINQKKAYEISKKLRTKYFIFGSVNEWRYKTGIEAMPTVALEFRVFRREDKRVVYVASGAKNGGGGDSLGSLTQELILELIR